MFFAPVVREAIKMYREKDERGLYRDKDFVFKNKSTNANQKIRDHLSGRGESASERRIYLPVRAGKV